MRDRHRAHECRFVQSIRQAQAADARIQLAHSAQQFGAVHARTAQVADERIDVATAELRQSRFPGRDAAQFPARPGRPLARAVVARAAGMHDQQYPSQATRGLHGVGASVVIVVHSRGYRPDPRGLEHRGSKRKCRSQLD